MVVQLLIVGLGNLPYPLTRHSVGHLIIDSLASRLGLRLSPDRALGGLAAQTDVVFGDTRFLLTLCKPKPLMNITGPAVSSALRHTTKSPESLIVVHDSLSHNPCTLSPKSGGSANGHNGVKSIIAALGGDAEFFRLRVGIGRNAGDAAEYVMGPLSPREKEFWRPGGAGLDLVWKEIERFARRLTTSS